MSHADVLSTAVFIDGDWFIHATRQLKVQVDYGELASSLHTSFGAGTRLSFFLSVDESKQDQRDFAEAWRQSVSRWKVFRSNRSAAG